MESSSKLKGKVMANNKKKKKQEKSLIDELIELKFPKDKRTPENISNFISQLMDEVLDLSEEINGMDDDDDDFDDEKMQLSDGHTARLEDENFPDGMIPFVVLKKDTGFLDYKCPHCSKEDKISLRKFNRIPFKDMECAECKKEFLIKIKFDPSIQVFSEIKNERDG